MIANTYVFISFFLCMSCLSFLCFFSPLPSPSLLFIRSPTHFELTKKYVQRLVFHRYIRRHRGDCSSFSRSLGQSLSLRWWSAWKWARGGLRFRCQGPFFRPCFQLCCLCLTYGGSQCGCSFYC